MYVQQFDWLKSSCAHTCTASYHSIPCTASYRIIPCKYHTEQSSQKMILTVFSMLLRFILLFFFCQIIGLTSNLELGRWWSVREAIKKKSRLPMDFFRKGSDPPPPYFRKLWNPWGIFEFWSPKRGKTKLPKNTQNSHI